MFIHPIYNNQNLYAKKPSQSKKPSDTNPVAFKGINQEVLRNQFKILLTQDIWAEKLKVKMPETKLEKDVLLEILENRLKLDRYTRLTNERFRLKGKLSHLRSLMEENPSHPDLPKLQKEIENKGNLESVFKTLDKNIELEAKKNQSAIDFFKNIDKLGDEYFKKRLIRPTGMEKFWYKIKKQNINIKENYSTKELIDLISNNQAQQITKTAQAVQIPSKKQVLMQIEKEYEQMLRESIDVYEGRLNHNDDAQRARKEIFSKNVTALAKIHHFEKQIPKIFEKIEQKFTHKVNRLEGIDIYPIGEIWKDMDKVETAIKNFIKDIKVLKEKVAQQPDNKEFQKALLKKEKALAAEWKEWQKGLKFSVKYENINRERMAKAGRLPEYDYLTAENSTIKRHKMAIDILQKNSNTIPEEFWMQVLS